MYLQSEHSVPFICLKWNSRQNATEAVFVNVYESNLHLKT